MPLWLAFAACTPPHGPGDRVTSAVLVDADSNSIAVVGGAITGDAALVYEGPDGSGVIPVSVNGGKLGVVVDFTGDLNPRSDIPLDLTEADPGLTVGDLMGTYHGTGWSFTVGLGGGGSQFQNRHGVRFDDQHWSAGVGVFAGYSWVRIRHGGNEVLEIIPSDDTGNPPADDSAGDSGRLDTSFGDTSAQGSDLLDENDERSPRGCGCGGAGDSGSDDEPEPSEPSPEDEAPGGGGCSTCGGAPSSNGTCGCSTAHRSIALTLSWVTAFAAVRRRR